MVIEKVSGDRATITLARKQRYAGAAAGLAVTTAVLAGCGSSAHRETRTANAGGQERSAAGSVPARASKDGSQQVLLEGSRHIEVQEFGAQAFLYWYNAAAPTATIPAGTRVAVDCVERGSVVATAPDWYHIIAPTQYATTFAAANTFWNQVPPQPPDRNIMVDPLVPDCPY